MLISFIWRLQERLFRLYENHTLGFEPSIKNLLLTLDLGKVVVLVLHAMLVNKDQISQTNRNVLVLIETNSSQARKGKQRKRQMEHSDQNSIKICSSLRHAGLKNFAPVVGGFQDRSKPTTPIQISISVG